MERRGESDPPTVIAEHGNAAVDDLQKWMQAGPAGRVRLEAAVDPAVRRWHDASPDEQGSYEAAAMLAAQEHGRRSPTGVKLLGIVLWRNIGVMDNLLRSGKIFRSARSNGVLGVPENFRMPDEAEADALSYAVSVQGLERFADRAVEQRKWSPSGGQSVRSWFIRDCLYGFSNAFRDWRRHYLSTVTLDTPDAVTHTDDFGRTDLLLSLSKDQAALALQLDAGFTRQEIATTSRQSRATSFRRQHDLRRTVSNLRQLNPPSDDDLTAEGGPNA